MSGLAGFLMIGVLVWLALTRTAAGRRLQAKLGGTSIAAAPAAAANEDHEFLLRVCGGDEGELFRRLEVETRRNPNLEEGMLYRRAIRSWFHEKRGGTHGEPGGEGSEGSDTWL